MYKDEKQEFQNSYEANNKGKRPRTAEDAGYSQKEGKKRGKEDINVVEFASIPDELKSMGKGRTYCVITLGCQMNEHDGETIAGILEHLGYTATTNEREADVVLYNTCAIRESAEDRVYGHLGALKAIKLERPDMILGVCGCMSQDESVVNRILSTYQHVDLIFGTHNIHRLPLLLQDAYFNKEMVVEVWAKEGDVIENMPKLRENGLKAWVNIIYGCDKFCTYCIVPYTRGKERSRMPQDVIDEVRELARQGYKEVTLLGQNVNAYGKDLEKTSTYLFGDLMDDLSKIGIPRIRFTTSHPRDFDDHLIEVLAKGGNLLEHIHLPVQSGNSEVLKKMARSYTREEYVSLANKIKKIIPHAVLTTDFIVGFPGESEEQFQDTLSLMEQIRFDFAYTFIYSPRHGTPAEGMEDEIPEEVKKERLQRLMAVVNRISREKNEALLGEVVEVLVEGESKNNPDVLAGRTRGNKLVHFTGPEDCVGQIVHVRITEPQTWALKGQLLTRVEV